MKKIVLSFLIIIGIFGIDGKKVYNHFSTHVSIVEFADGIVNPADDDLIKGNH
jgi:hypothetical protein